MADLAALKTELENDDRYDVVVRTGANSQCVDLLNALKPGSARRWRPVPVDDFLDVTAGETLTTVQEERIRTYTQQRGHVPLHKPNVKAWMLSQGWSPATVQAITDLSEVDGKFSDPFLDDGEEEITLANVREVVRTIAKSFIVSTGQV